MKYYISDTHFFHENVLKFDKRPYSSVEEMNKALIENWNNKVEEADEVYFLGDFSFGKVPQTIDILSQLKGKKYLVKGNHDGRYLKDQRFPKLWEGISDILEIDDFVDNKLVHLSLCHYPVLSFKGRYRKNYFHLYGHLHNTSEEKLTLRFIKEIAEKEKETNERAESMEIDGTLLSAKMYNVGCMMPYMNYAPQDIKTILLGGQKYYDGYIQNN